MTNLSAGVFWLAAWQGRIFSTHFERGAVGWLESANPASPWVVTFLIWVVFINTLMILFAILAGRKTTLNRSRRMVRMIIFPSAFFGPISVLANLVLPLLGHRWIPPLAHIIFGVLTIFIGLSVLRYRMLSIEPGFVIENLFLDITDMVVLTDMDGVIRKSNHSLSNQASLFPEPLIGEPLSVILPEVELRGQAIYRAPQKRVLETSLRLPSTETIPVRVSLSVVTDLHDDPVGYFFLLHDLRDMRKIAQFAADLQETNEKLELLSNTDSLTGIWNRAKFNQMLQTEFERYKRYAEPFSLIVFDIDKFKLINDTFGHLAGDEVLRDIVARVKQEIRTTDIFARWGGDEFAILLPYQDTGGAVLVTDRLRKAVTCVTGSVMCVTVSVGMTTVTRRDTLTTLFERADAAVYRAKEQGGDCFVLG
jgi:diguanylate cyclase (GGDEF)-like protein